MLRSATNVTTEWKHYSLSSQLIGGCVSKIIKCMLWLTPGCSQVFNQCIFVCTQEGNVMCCLWYKEQQI